LAEGVLAQFWLIKRGDKMSKTMISGDRVDMRVFSLSLLLLAGVVGPLPELPGGGLHVLRGVLRRGWVRCAT
jgi:hypothetical protein